MKNHIVLFLLVSAFVRSHGPLMAADSPILSANLRPLQTFLGVWNVCWTDSKGEHRSAKATFTPEAGGTIVIFEARLLDREGKPLLCRASIFFWDTESKSIAGSDFDSNGWRGSNALAEIGGHRLIFEGAGCSGTGKTDCTVTEMVKSCENRWTVQVTRHADDSAEIPDSPKFTFTRAK